MHGVFKHLVDGLGVYHIPLKFSVRACFDMLKVGAILE